MKFILLFFTTLLLSCSIESHYPVADWTLMFYLGDDSSPTIYLTNDIYELTKNQVVTSDVRIIILYDGPKDGDSRITVLDTPFNLTSRTIPISSSDIDYSNSGEVDMSAPETLKAFIRYSKEKLPANRYALYFGGHGTGFTSSFNSGLSFENNISVSSQIIAPKDISNSIKAEGGVNLINFDACLMGNIETIYEFKDIVDFIIASPEEIPGPGNQYTSLILSAISLTDMSALELGKSTLEAYYNYYNENKENINYYEAKSLQQLYNVDKISEIVDSNGFEIIIINSVDNRDSSEHTFNSNNYVDIYSLINEQLALELSLDSAITTANEGIYTWLSIYMPLSNYYSSEYENTAFATKFPDWVSRIEN